MSDCVLCNLDQTEGERLLRTMHGFHITGDANPLVEGHLLVIPTHHVACIGQYTPDQLRDFQEVNQVICTFMKNTYGKFAIFEHGTLGQTVFHSHVHYIPFDGTLSDVVPEGETHATKLQNLNQLSTIYNRDGGYLYVNIDDQAWTIDPTLAFPRFFRDRFATALNVPERANWRAVRANPELTKAVEVDVAALAAKWNAAH